MIAKVYRAENADMAAAYGIVKEYYEAAAVVVREDLERFAKDYFADGAGVWLAEEDGKIIGCVALRKLSGKAGCGEIKRLYVRPELRGRGIADRLVEALEQYAKECGYEWLYLDTAVEMKAAARFYEKRGFEPCGRYNENPQAAIFMRKRLARGPSSSASRFEKRF